MSRAPDAIDVVVIGAGIVGLCCALNLQRSGRAVTLIDPQPSGTGASFGNAGLINVDAHLPVAIPGMIRHVPRWLLDPAGPLSVRPCYALRAAPWLLRWLRASSTTQVRRAAPALRALHSVAHDEYRHLLGDRLFDDLIRVTGGVALLPGDTAAPGEAFTGALRKEMQIEAQPLDRAALVAIFPGIAPFARRGLLFPRNGHTVSPARLTGTLARLFVEAGGTIRAERVMKIVPRPGGGAMLMTNVANTHASAVVVAAGAWSRALLDPLGVRIPLETERGYHLHLTAPSVNVALPIIHRAAGFAITPMEDGLRLAGLVEIAGLDAAPDERRPRAMLTHARALFPGLTGTAERLWMGFRPSLPDSLPAIGRAAAHPWLHVAVGHGHDGMIGAPATGRLVAERLAGAPPFIDPKPYRLERF